MFSSSDEFESALITERRAQGLYSRRAYHWPVAAFAAGALAVAATVLLFS